VRDSHICVYLCTYLNMSVSISDTYVKIVRDRNRNRERERERERTREEMREKDKQRKLTKRQCEIHSNRARAYAYNLSLCFSCCHFVCFALTNFQPSYFLVSLSCTQYVAGMCVLKVGFASFAKRILLLSGSFAKQA